MSKYERITVEEVVRRCLDIEELLGGRTIEEVKHEMDRLEKMYQGRDVHFEARGYGHDGGIELVLVERRPETDKEYEKRVANLEREEQIRKRNKEAKLERDRKEYERLKRIFERGDE